MMQPSKEKILFISQWIPRPDTNSGDLRLFSILEILAKDYKIFYIATTPMSGDDAYISLLEQNDINVHVGPFSVGNLLKTDKFRVAIMERFLVAEYYLDRIRILQPECRIIVDSVDVHYLRLGLKYEVTRDEADHIIYRDTKERELAVYRKADVVITVTQDDAAALLDERSDITCEVVPNVHEFCVGNARPEGNTLIFIGCFNHEPNADAVLFFCNEILPLIRQAKPDIHFTIVGPNPPDKIRELENGTITVTGLVPKTTPYLHSSRISIAPLRFGAGMKGKIGEAMAHGVPVVTTSVGAQGMGLTDRKNVMIADTPRSFADAVLELLNDNSLYETVRKNAMKIIADNYTPKRVAQSMNDALKRTCEKPVRRMNLLRKVAFFNGYVAERIRSKLFGAEAYKRARNR